MSLAACDAIVNKDKLVPPEDPQVPQPVVEAVPGYVGCYTYPNGAAWLAEFPISSYRNLMLVNALRWKTIWKNDAMESTGKRGFGNHLLGNVRYTKRCFGGSKKYVYGCWRTTRQCETIPRKCVLQLAME